MIKLFRTIRQNLLNEGKTSRYLKYAIGEIILVVIGILIALQINNWNIKRLNLEKETKYLKEINNNFLHYSKKPKACLSNFINQAFSFSSSGCRPSTTSVFTDIDIGLVIHETLLK